LAADDDVSSSDWGSAISYTPTRTGNYFLEASSSPNDTVYPGTGTYRIYTSASQSGAAVASSGTALDSSGSAVILGSSGDQTFTTATAPEIFDFSSVSFGNDTIAGFDPTHDEVCLSDSLPGNFAAVQ
jgi:hypothetical protein